MHNKIFLKDLPLKDAWTNWISALQSVDLWQVLGVEDISVDEMAVGRILYEPVWAKICSPHYHSCAMDGFAIQSESITSVRLTNPIMLHCDSEIGSPEAVYVDTGDPLPDWANAVIPIENVEPLGSDGEYASNPRKPSMIRIHESVTPWAHVRPMGEDMVVGQMVLPSRHVLSPIDIGAIAGSGNTSVRVTRRPNVAIIPTGTELVEIGNPVKTGQILEFNSVVLAAQVNTWGGCATRFPITRDDFKLIRETVSKVANHFDLVLLIAGSSAGSEDFSADVIEDLGKVIVHGVAVRPGHPVILGVIEPRTPIIGIPGYPVSAALTGEIFIKPLLSKWLTSNEREIRTVDARLTRKVTSPAGDDEYMRVVLGQVGDEIVATPLPGGAGVISSMVKADGILIIPAGTQGYQPGTKVKINLYRSMQEISRTILAIGSHDIALEILTEFLVNSNRRLVSANVGSLGGLFALRNREAHLAGSHLLDPQTGKYNITYINKYLLHIPVKRIGFVQRIQGFLVQRGNPKRVFTLEDLLNPDIKLVNRQKGSGTRVLLDYHLEKLSIEPKAIRGYSYEEYSHLAVAASIYGGRGDVGLGIAAAAHALNLDFIPLFTEDYELIIPDEFFYHALLGPLLDVINDKLFHNKVKELPGYEVIEMGKILK